LGRPAALVRNALDQARSAYHDGKEFVLFLPHLAAALMVQQR
jgi:hypothetical protein